MSFNWKWKHLRNKRVRFWTFKFDWVVTYVLYKEFTPFSPSRSFRIVRSEHFFAQLLFSIAFCCNMLAGCWWSWQPFCCGCDTFVYLFYLAHKSFRQSSYPNHLFLLVPLALHFLLHLIVQLPRCTYSILSIRFAPIIHLVSAAFVLLFCILNLWGF